MSIIVNRKELEKAILKKFRYFETASRALGYSHDGLGKALRSGVITKRMEESLRRFGIEAKDYSINNYAINKADIEITDCKDLETEAKDKYPERTQISIDDYESIKKDELKSIIKEAIIETLDDFVCKEISGAYDPLTRVYTVNIKIK